MNGATASRALECIAEVGDPAEAIATLGATMIDAAVATGDSTTFTVAASPGDLLSFASILVGSNDGFVGVNGLALFDSVTPRSIMLDLTAWDAGTEMNSDLNSGFADGQPDPAQGAANLDNGIATADPIGGHAQLAGTQATLMIRRSSRRHARRRPPRRVTRDRSWAAPARRWRCLPLRRSRLRSRSQAIGRPRHRATALSRSGRSTAVPEPRRRGPPPRRDETIADGSSPPACRRPEMRR